MQRLRRLRPLPDGRGLHPIAPRTRSAFPTVTVAAMPTRSARGSRRGPGANRRPRNAGARATPTAPPPAPSSARRITGAAAARTRTASARTSSGGPAPVCDPSSGYCFECLTDADCTGPNGRACSRNRCYACRTSTDCAQNSDGSLCEEIGGNAPGVGQCGCTTDTDCAGHAGGPYCVSNISTFKKCGCATAADCAGDPQGHSCVNPANDGWLQCGCSTAADCPSGKACPYAGATCR